MGSPEILEEYLATLTPQQRRRWERLSRCEPTVVRTDIKCPDCGSQLKLNLGRYGRFYGCETHAETGCRGGVSAHEDGTPMGTPAKAEERALRHQLVTLFKTPLDPELQRFRLKAVLRLTKQTELRVVELSRLELEKSIVIVQLCSRPNFGRFERLRIESLLPDEG